MSADLETSRELLATSLPTYRKWELMGTWLSFDFSRLTQPLRRLTEESITGNIPETWSRYFAFGEERFANGSAFLCIDATDGSIQRIDVELDDPILLVNRNALPFVDSFVLLDKYLAEGSGNLADIAKLLRSLDEYAYDKESHWHMLLDYLLGETNE